MQEHDANHRHHDMAKLASTSMAAKATLHCLIGCMIGELLGVTIGTHVGFPPLGTVFLAFVMSFLSGYTVSTIPLVRARLTFRAALRLVFAADTLSILTMVVADSILMISLPGAMDKDLSQPIYWISRGSAVILAFVVAFPVNIYLLRRGKGHALTHEYHHRAR